MKTTSIFIFLTFFIIISVSAQDSLLNLANQAYIEGDFYEALKHYKKAEKIDRRNNEIKVRLANCYYHLNNYEEAQKNYDRVKKEELFATDLVNIALLLQHVENYEMAIATYARAKSDGAMNPLLNNYMESCRWALLHADDRYFCDVLESNFFTQGQFFGVQYYRDGVVFSSTSAVEGDTATAKTEQKLPETDSRGFSFLDLFYAEEDKGQISNISVFSTDLLFPLHEGAVSFSPDFNTIYFTKSVIELPESNIFGKTNNLTKPVSVLKIFQADFDGKNWVNIQELPFNSNTYSCAHPSISSDGNTLYFSSNMPGGKGRRDLYRVKKEADKWGTPQNLGDSINTIGDEIFPFIYKDSTLYFASTGQIGYGGYDIYSSKIKGAQWGSVANMEKWINSSKDDFGFVINPQDSTEAYVVSNRDGDGTSDKVFLVRIFPDEKKLPPQDYSLAAEFDPDSENYNVDWTVQRALYPTKKGEKQNKNNIVETTEPVDESTEISTSNSSEFFQIELLSSTELIEKSDPQFEGMEIEIYKVGGKFRYTTGEYDDETIAKGVLKDLQELGFPEAVLTNYSDSDLYNSNEKSPEKPANKTKDTQDNKQENKQKQNQQKTPEAKTELQNATDKTQKNNTQKNNNNSPPDTSQADLPATEGIVYRIQFLSSPRLIENLSPLGYKVYKYYHKGEWRYTIGEFRIFDDGKDLRLKVIAEGYEGSFIAKFVNGERVEFSLNE